MKKMLTKLNRIVALVTLAVAVFIGGCSYYRVTDPATQKIYYTTEVKELKSGAVKLTDAKTKKAVTIQNSEVEKIDEDEYKKGIYSK
ncbi:MAG: hypothetical protein ACYSWP_01065 [Planctomycetota bacterium]|jgi:hypothetical protein